MNIPIFRILHNTEITDHHPVTFIENNIERVKGKRSGKGFKKKGKEGKMVIQTVLKCSGYSVTY